MSEWDYSDPFVHRVTVGDEAIDIMGHVNNVQYLRWLEETAWKHSDALGLGWAVYEELGVGVVAVRHEIDYLRPAFAGENLEIATWCTGNDKRLRLRRDYQVRCADDARTCVRGRTYWVCVDLSSGKPRRMPADFIEHYQPVEGSPPYP